MNTTSSTPPPATSPPIRTLVVDDDPAVATVHAGWVMRMDGFELVGVAHSGSDAITAVAARDPHLILLDIFLPDLSGIEVLREVRSSERGHEVGVIAITAAKEVDTVRAAMAGGVAHYLVKPFSAETFRSRLRDFAAHHHELTKRSVQSQVRGQSDVDRMLRASTDRDWPRLPKGLSSRSMQRIVDVLRDDDLTAAEAARRSGMSRVTARRYLDHLEQFGAVEAEPQYGSPGRPALRYHMIDVPPQFRPKNR